MQQCAWDSIWSMECWSGDARLASPPFLAWSGLPVEQRAQAMLSADRADVRWVFELPFRRPRRSCRGARTRQRRRQSCAGTARGGAEDMLGESVKCRLRVLQTPRAGVRTYRIQRREMGTYVRRGHGCDDQHRTRATRTPLQRARALPPCPTWSVSIEGDR